MIDAGKDQFCPRGYRFLIQLVDEMTEESSRERVGRMFGDIVKMNAVVVPGFRSAGECGRFCHRRSFRVYLPSAMPTYSESSNGSDR